MSAYGLVASEWEREGDKVIYTVSVPANCTAELILNGESTTLKAGNYQFVKQE